MLRYGPARCCVKMTEAQLEKFAKVVCKRKSGVALSIWFVG